MMTCLNCGYESETAFKFCPSCGTEAVTSPGSGDPFLGKILNKKYRILDLVGAGAMGKVYRAEHTSLKKIVAIKVLHDDLMVNDESVQRFQGEGIAAGKFTHANAIQIFDFDKDESDGHWFLAMEFVEGVSLKDMLTEKGAMGSGSAVDLIIQVLDALGEAHRQGIIHRDLKPDNIMVLENASGELSVKVLDFGLSKLVDTQAGSAMLTQTGRILGTPRYMAPEQWGGVDVDHRIDIYAAGLVLYEMLTGEAPFSSTTIQDAIVQSAQEPVPSLTESDLDIQIPDGLDEIIGIALAKDKEDRFETTEAMVEDLLALDFTKIVRSRKPSAMSRSRAARRQPTKASSSGSKMPLVLGGVAVLVIAAVLFFVLGGGPGKTYDRLTQKPAAERTEEEKTYVAALSQTRGHLRKNDLKDALKSADDACHMACVDAEAFFVRAAVYRARGDDQAARLDLQDAIKRDPKYAEAVAGIGWIDLDTGSEAEATKQFDAAVKLKPGLASALVGKALLALQREDQDAAGDLLAKVDVSKASADLQIRMGDMFLVLADRSADAVTAFTMAKRNANFDWRVHYGLGRAYMLEQDDEKAREALTAAVQLNEKNLEIRTALATLHVEKQRWPEALAVTKAGLELKSDHKPLLVLQGVAMNADGNDMGAIVALEKGARADDLKAQLLLGILYQGQRRWTDAIKIYEKLQTSDPNNPTPYLNHGLCLLEREDYEAAGAKIKRAAELNKNDPFTMLSYGIVAMEYLGDKKAALDALNRYQALGGEDKRVDGWIDALSKGGAGK